MFTKEIKLRFERSAVQYDVLTCPSCNSRSNLTIYWTSINANKSEELTSVGCKKCKTFFTEKEDCHAITFWNNYALIELLKKGKKIKHNKLYKYLYQKAKAEKEADFLQDKINQYLEENISTKCKFSIGDIIRDKRDTKYNWIVKELSSVYGVNTGAFWILKVQCINKNGKILEGETELWENDEKFLESGVEFYQPTRWTQLKSGNACLYQDLEYTISSINLSKREAKLKNGIKETKMNSLTKLKISVHDINET